MQIDIYTKVVLTVIAIGVGLLVFDLNPVKDAHAAFPGDQNVPVIHERLLNGVSNKWLEFSHTRTGWFVRTCVMGWEHVKPGKFSSCGAFFIYPDN